MQKPLNQGPVPSLAESLKPMEEGDSETDSLDSSGEQVVTLDEVATMLKEPRLREYKPVAPPPQLGDAHEFVQGQLNELLDKIATLERLNNLDKPAQEIRASIEKPVEADADIAVERLPEVPRPLPAPKKAANAECAVQWENNPSDAMAKYRSVIKELLAILGTIASSTARPSDELSAIARSAIISHSKYSHE